jgi:hypothetical protein
MINAMVQTYERACADMTSEIFTEVVQAMTTLASQSSETKKLFAMPLKGIKESPMNMFLDNLKSLSYTSKDPEITLVFNLLTTLVLQTECVNVVIKTRALEDLSKKLIPTFKQEKDINLSKLYLSHYFKFLGAFTQNPEGLISVVSHNTIFDFAIFILETISPPSDRESDYSLQLLNHILIFLGSASAYRTNKLHFLSQPGFLPRILSILTSPHGAFPLKSKAFAAQTLWVVLHNHQGVKAAISK